MAFTHPKVDLTNRSTRQSPRVHDVCDVPPRHISCFLIHWLVFFVAIHGAVVFIKRISSVINRQSHSLSLPLLFFRCHVSLAHTLTLSFLQTLKQSRGCDDEQRIACTFSCLFTLSPFWFNSIRVFAQIQMILYKLLRVLCFFFFSFAVVVVVFFYFGCVLCLSICVMAPSSIRQATFVGFVLCLECIHSLMSIVNNAFIAFFQHRHILSAFFRSYIFFLLLLLCLCVCLCISVCFF